MFEREYRISILQRKVTRKESDADDSRQRCANFLTPLLIFRCLGGIVTGDVYQLCLARSS